MKVVYILTCNQASAVILLYWSTLLEAYVLGRFIYAGEKWNEHASDCQLVLQSTDEAYDNDSALIRIELNSKEVIGRSCQMLKARLVHGRIKQKR